MPLLLLAVVLLAASPPARAAGWRLPVPGAPVAGPFRLVPGRPFAAGQRRGVDLRVAPGASVGAPCAGVVRYAGPVPGRGVGVSIRCGALVATVLGLSHTLVRRGTPVFPGLAIGTAGMMGLVRLGARRAGERFGYVDPLALVRTPARRPPLIAPRAPRGRPGPSVPPPVPSARAPLPRARLRPAAPVPAFAWVGVVLLATGLTVHIGLWRRTGRRRPAPAFPAHTG